MRRHILCGILLGGLWLATGCATTEEFARLQHEVEMLKQHDEQRRVDQQQMSRELAQAQQEVEWLVEQSPACLHRSAGKKLLTSCQDGRCDPQMFAQALDGLRDEREIFIAAYLDPERGAESLIPQRLFELERLFQHHSLRPMTRLVIVVLPRSPAMAEVDKAEVIKAGLVKRIRDKLNGMAQVRTHAATVACSEENTRRVREYASRKPPVRDELSTGKKQIRGSDRVLALLFRLDCW